MYIVSVESEQVQGWSKVWAVLNSPTAINILMALWGGMFLADLL